MFDNKAKSFLANLNSIQATGYTGYIETSLWLPDVIAVAMKCKYWCILSQEGFTANMSSIQFKTKELLMFHSGYHEDLVSIATRYVTDAYCLRKP